MVYLNEFYLLSEDDEWQFFRKMSRGCYDSFYPFQFFPQQKELSELYFSDITILCGSNGSGKSTLLNIIAEKLELKRETPFNKTDFFDPYIERCGLEMSELSPEAKRDLMKVSRIITSDDVFKHILGVRERNENLSFKRGLIFEEKADMALNGWQGPRGFNADDPESIKAYQDYYQKFRQPASKYIRKNVGVDERTFSNGENGFKYFTDAIQPGGLYLLDEPENSLSAEMQLQLVQYIQSMARFYECQFIMSTHSPFLLSLPYARIYNMDEVPVNTCKWTELSNVRLFYDFFKEHRQEFE
jgi:predicted ATPase